MNVLLRDIATIRGGYPFRKGIEKVPDGRYRVIQIKDLDRFTLDSFTSLVQTNLFDVRPDHLICEGDVLFGTRGERRRAAVVSEYLPNTIFSGQVFACSTNGEVLPDYLAWYINQKPAQKYLGENAGGTNVRIVTVDALAKLPITVPLLDIQRSIAELYRLSLHERQLMDEINRKRTQLVEQSLLQSINKYQ